MIFVTGTLGFDPAKADETRQAIAAVVSATLAEDGCADYGFFERPNEPGMYQVIEQWESEDALNAHFVAPHMATFMGSAGDLGVHSTDIWRHDVSSSQKLM